MAERTGGGVEKEHGTLTGESLPLRPAIASISKTHGDESMSPRSGPAKVVSIAESPESIPVSPTILSLDNAPPKQFSAGLAKRLTGRPSVPSVSSSRASLSGASMEDLPAAAIPSGSGHAHPHGHQSSHHDKLLSQVSEWLQAEKAKRAARKSKKTHNIGADGDAEIAASRERSGSQSSDSSVLSLEKLQRILEDNMAAFGHETLPSDASSTSLAPRRPSVLGGPRKRPSSRTLALNRTASSDTEYHDGDVVVPSCDEVLDNSKTLSYTGGAAVSTSDLATTSKRAEKERKAWSVFKNEILRLAHTLRLKGWRRVPLDRGDDIEVERLSGALTNAVYVVSPPTHLPAATDNAATAPVSKKPPPKLLLRIYGPQVEHLIDRENELGILRRLARKKIGPRLLGTFKNGRFEEYFESTTLTSADLRVPETSKQIAKRMRELHEGIDLLAQEREDGPFVWRNWDKWVERCEKVISFLDAQILSGEPSKGGKGDAWKENGLICGVEWPHFRAMVDKYRQYVVDYYGGPGKVAERLVFAHNDTQYGNILRLKPSGESPLLLPANTHKQLVVIDFEYASANTPGLEFANHFTEWCYNYHDSVAPHACNTANYPTPEEQRRFILSYVNHRPQFNPKASATPKQAASEGPRGGVREFMLDSRAPAGLPDSYKEEEEKRLKAAEEKVKHLMAEARLWRIANSAQWVAWGIVQAQVDGLDDDEEPSASSSSTPSTRDDPKMHAISMSSDKLSSDVQEKHDQHLHDHRPEGLVAEALAHGGDKDKDLVKEAEKAEAEDDEDEFDYLGYAHQRAMFFWGDCVELGLVKLEELPEALRGAVRIVAF